MYGWNTSLLLGWPIFRDKLLFLGSVLKMVGEIGHEKNMFLTVWGGGYVCPRVSWLESAWDEQRNAAGATTIPQAMK